MSNFLHSPQGVAALAAIGAFCNALLEYWLGRTKKVKAGSVLEGVFNVIGVIWPKVAQLLGTPNGSRLELPAETTKPGTKPPPIPIIIVAWILCGGIGFGASCTLHTAGTVVAYAVADCGPAAFADYQEVRSALHTGGEGWLPVVLSAGECLEAIIHDELRAHGVCASADGGACMHEAPGEVGRAKIALAEWRKAKAEPLP